MIGGAILATCLGLGAAQAKPVHYIQCGDKPSPGLPEHIAEFEKANPGVTIELEVVGWSQCEQKATTLAAAGNPPGIAYLGSRALPQLQENGLIVPVTLTDAEKSAYYPAVLRSVTYDGKVLGLPIAMSTQALYYNKDLFRQAGLDPEKPPTTWQQLYDDAAAIKAKTGVPGYGMPARTFSSTAAIFMLWVYTNGANVLEDGKVTMNSPQMVEVLEWYKKMAEVSEPGPSAYIREELRPMFDDAKIGMFMSGPWERNRINKKIDFGVAPLPVGPSGKPGDLVVTDSLAVFKGSGVEDAAQRFVKFLTNPENERAYEQAYGLTPMRQGPEVAALVQATPSWKPFVDGLAVAGPEPQFPDYVDFQKTVCDAIQSVLLGQATPKEAVAKAAAHLEKQ
jgi:multiple sugar transport system substrate-binding protein